MPRDGADIYVLPFPNVEEDTTIESTVYNGFTNDVAQDLNAPRPIIAGGTGGISADAALINLSGEKAGQVVTNYDTMMWMGGSFYSASSATAPPVAAHAFSGIVYITDANNGVIEARDSTDGKLYIRRKIAGVWGAWTLDGDLSGVNAAIAALDAAKVAKAGDTMTGPLVLPPAAPTLGTHATNKTYVDAADAALAAVDTTQNTDIANRVRYDTAQVLSAAQTLQVRVNIDAPLRGYLAGLALSTAGSSTTFTVAAGEAANSTTSDLMQLASSLAKTTAAWTVGAGGALDTGSIANNTWYHVYLIKRLDTNVVDVLLSTNATTPTLLPTNYTVFRRIGAMKTNASGQWTLFQQVGDEFIWDVPVLDAAGSGMTTTATLFVLSVPPGVNVLAKFNAMISTTSGGMIVLFTSPLVSVQVANTPTGNFNINAYVTGSGHSNALQIMTNTSAQIRAVANNSGGTQATYIDTTGWTDRRGRDA